jgi:hypothetical protein
LSKSAIGSLETLRPNPDWAKLPLFERKGWKRLPFGAFAESVNQRVEPSEAGEEIYVGLDDLDPQDLHIRRWGKGSDVILADKEPEKRGREIEIKLVARLRRHLGNPKFTALCERLEKIKERHEQGFLTSLEFLKQILELAKEVVAAEKETDPEEERDRAKEALTELFTEARNSNTHIIVERVVADIDDIVKKVRFPDWQHTTQGERLVQKELRRTLLKYKLHSDQELFDRAYAYIKQYY